MTGDDIEIHNLEYLVEQEREQFKLYESRREAVENQATALTAAGLTIGALILVAVKDSASSHRLAGVALLCLAPTLAFALLTRFVSWTWPRVLGAPKNDYSVAVAKTLDELRAMDGTEKPIAVRRATHAHWRARAESAWKLGDHKKTLLMCGIVGLVPALAFLVVRGISLVG